jgi:hypothetical protein
MRLNNVDNRIDKYRQVKKGRASDLGNIYFRSRWERNWARYLNFLIEHGEISGWEYEPKIFWFENIKRGTRSYTPDFKVWNLDGSYVWHEVKGWMDQKSKTKIRRFSKYYPEEILEIVDKKRYKTVENQLSGIIPRWEQDG